MDQKEFELYLLSKESFAQTMCDTVHTALKFKFPDINNLDVFIGDDFEICVAFNESEGITHDTVTAFLNEFKKPNKQT